MTKLDASRFISALTPDQIAELAKTIESDPIGNKLGTTIVQRMAEELGISLKDGWQKNATGTIQSLADSFRPTRADFGGAAPGVTTRQFQLLEAFSSPSRPERAAANELRRLASLLREKLEPAAARNRQSDPKLNRPVRRPEGA